MAYRLKRSEDVLTGVQRIAHEQLEKAAADLTDDDLDLHEKVHQVRKRFKKIRGALRLSRPLFPKTYQKENQWYRDKARRLSKARDCTARLETFEAICERYGTILKVEPLTPLASELTEQRNRVTQDSKIDSVLESILRELNTAAMRISTWSIEKRSRSWTEGLAKTYKRARNAMATASETPNDDALHQWRKRVKYHMYHCRLIRNVWPPVLKARISQLNQLGTLLGDDHDLADFEQFLKTHEVRSLDETALQGLHAVIVEERQSLQGEGFELGRKLFCESKTSFIARMESYWSIWKDAKNS